MNYSKKLLFYLGSLTSIPLTCSITSCAQDQKYEYDVESKEINRKQIKYLVENNITNNLLKINNKFIYEWENKPTSDDVLVENFSNKIANTTGVSVSIDDFIGISNEIDLDRSSNYEIRNYFNNKYPNQYNKPNIYYFFWLINDDSDYWKKIFPDFIAPKNLRIQSFSNNYEQIKIYENMCNFYLKYFNFESEWNVKFSNIQNENNEKIILELLFLDVNNNSKLVKVNLQNFFKYSNINKNYEFENISNEITFNEYIEDAELLVTPNNELNLTTFDSLLENGNNFNAKGFNYLISQKKEWFYVDIPRYKKHIDQKYEIVLDTNKLNQFAEFTRDYNISKVYVQITKKNGDIKILPWYSVDFNIHRHLMGAYKTLENNSVKNWSPVLNNYTSPSNVTKEFIQSIIDSVQKKHKNNLNLWNGRRQSQIEAYEIKLTQANAIKLFEILLNDEILKYMIAKNELFINSVKSVQLKIIEHKNPGRLLISLYFKDFENNEINFDFENNFELKGFLGDVIN